MHPTLRLQNCEQASTHSKLLWLRDLALRNFSTPLFRIHYFAHSASRILRAAAVAEGLYNFRKIAQILEVCNVTHN